MVNNMTDLTAHDAAPAWQTRDHLDDPVIGELRNRFGPDAFTVQPTRTGVPVVWVKREQLLEVGDFLKKLPKPYVMLFDLHGMDERLRTHRDGLPAADFSVFYHLISIDRNRDIMLKVALSENDLHLPTFTNLFPNDPPKFIVMEAQAADCLYRGALAGDGAPRIVDGDLQTIMAGLACGEPNTISWDILRNHATAFVSCPDWVSARGMRMLGVPVKGDPVVISGESGAVGMGLIAAIMETDEYKELREAIGLDRFSQVLMFSTEGNTDPMKFRKVLWDGEYPTV